MPSAPFGHRRGRARLSAPHRVPVTVFVVGLVLVGLYFLLRATGVGKIGEPTDIGGGLLLLAGYAVTFVGAVLVLLDVLRRPK